MSATAILLPRRQGKTTKLLEMMREDPDNSVMVCATHAQCIRLLRDNPGLQFVTAGAPAASYRRRKTFVDEAKAVLNGFSTERLLELALGRPITAFSDTIEDPTPAKPWNRIVLGDGTEAWLRPHGCINRIQTPDGRYSCFHGDHVPCPLVGHETVTTYYVEFGPCPEHERIRRPAPSPKSEELRLMREDRYALRAEVNRRGDRVRDLEAQVRDLEIANGLWADDAADLRRRLTMVRRASWEQ